MEKFEDILQHLLTAVEANPDMSVEEALKNALADMKMDAESMEEIEESFETLEAINEKSQSLATARKERKTRHGWLTDQLEEMAKVSGDMAEDIVSEIEKATKESLDNTLTQND